MERLGIFGGTFDPPHTGHLILAAEAAAQLQLDRVLWVLTPFPPHKPNQVISPVAVRIDLVRAAIDDNPTFELSTVDIDREPPHFAVDTIKLLRQARQDAELVYLIGADSLGALPSWHKPQEILQNIHRLGVLRRPGAVIDLAPVEAQIPGLSAKLDWIEAPLIEISASHIRQLVQSGGPYRYYLPEAVFRLVQARDLYR